MDRLQEEWKISTRHACTVLQIDRSLYVYKSKRSTQAELAHQIREICATCVHYGYRRVHILLQRDGRAMNPKQIYRLHKELGMQLRNMVPRSVRVDQGSEFISRDLDLRAYQKGIVLDFSCLNKNGGLASGLQRSPPTQCYRQQATDIAAEQFSGMLVG